MNTGNFIVAARKYRPQRFQDVVGQSAITETLQKAIEKDHLGQAFLFCGPRGVGKTSCARILAKTINCLALKEGVVEACEECDSCAAYREQKSFNIHELDAASNNSVEDIRSLVSRVHLPPSVGSKMVYIIDEVHMLSSAAFNAFLKTLEEPPAHVIFILATTEKHKILPTILSRCQVFDFQRITLKDLEQQIHYVAQQEGISLEEGVSHLIAKKADGGMRDALSIFDMLASGSDIILKETASIQLHALDTEEFIKITAMLHSGNIPGILIRLHQLLAKGYDGQLIINDLASHFRNLLVAKNAESAVLLETPDHLDSLLKEQSALFGIRSILQFLDIARQCDNQYRSSKNKQLLLELTLLQMGAVAKPELKS